MKKTKTLFIACVIVISCFAALPCLAAAEPNTDILPIGPSPYKLIIDKIETDQIIHTASGKTATIDAIIAANPATDVFIIGESHDNYQCHTFQRDFIQALHQKYPNLIIGFEFFLREDNPLLEQWRNGLITEEQLIKDTRWYERGSQNYGFTRLIMDLVRREKIKVIGLNIPRDILRTVSRKGFDQLSAAEKKLFPTIQIPNPEHEYFIKTIFGVFAAQVPMWFTNVYTAQKCWDVIMAESMRQILAEQQYKGYKAVIIAGGNHVAYRLGIPFRYLQGAKKTRITTIMPVLIREKEKTDDADEPLNPMVKMLAAGLKPAAVFSRGLADYVFGAPEPIIGQFPELGITVELKDNKLLVTEVSPKSIAAKNGINKDDCILAVDGIDITSREQLRLLLAQKNWEQSVTIKIEKQIPLKKESLLK